MALCDWAPAEMSRAKDVALLCVISRSPIEGLIDVLKTWIELQTPSSRTDGQTDGRGAFKINSHLNLIGNSIVIVVFLFQLASSKFDSLIWILIIIVLSNCSNDMLCIFSLFLLALRYSHDQNRLNTRCTAFKTHNFIVLGCTNQYEIVRLVCKPI